MSVQDEKGMRGSDDAGGTALRACKPAEEGTCVFDEVLDRQTKPQQGFHESNGQVRRNGDGSSGHQHA